MTFPAGASPAPQGGQGGWSPAPSQPAPQPTPNQSYNPGPIQVQHSQEPSGVLPYPAFPQQQQPQAPQQPPAQQLYGQQGYGQPPVVQQPHHAQQGYQYGQPAQGQPQPQGGVPAGARPVAQGVYSDAQGRLYGPGIPQELQGRTMQESLQAYNVMRQAAIQNVRQPMPQQQQPVQQPAQQRQSAPPAGAAPRSIFADPDGFIEQKIGSILDQKLGQYLAPVLEQTQEQQIQQARTQVANLYPQFSQYEGAVIQRLQGLPPETLANPHAWRLALLQEIGEQTLRQQQPGRPPQQGGYQQMQPPAPQGWQPASQNQQPGGWNQQPMAPAGSFFTESPSAANYGGMDPSQAPGMLSPQQLAVAQKFGMTPQQYLQGMGVMYGQ